MLNKRQSLDLEQQRSLAAFRESGRDAWLTEDGTVMVAEHEVLVLSTTNTRVMASPLFANGSNVGYAANKAMGDDAPASLTDHECTERIDQVMPWVEAVG